MIRFRHATEEDAGLISHLYASCWRTAYRGLIAEHYLDRLPDDYWVPSVRAWLQSGQESGMLIYEDKEPVGACIYGRGRDEDHATWGEIVSLYIHSAYLRQGYGKALLEHCLEELRGEGYKRFYLWAIQGNEGADRFYRTQGFHITSDQVAYLIGGQGVRDVRYVRVEDRSASA